MKSFLNNTEIELRITEGINWNKPIAIASSFALQYFKIKNPSEVSEDGNELLVQRQGLQLYFFGPKISTTVLKLNL